MPVAIAVIMALIAAASTYVSMQGQKTQAKYQEKIAKNNAVVSGYEADEARANSELKVRQHKLQVAGLLGKQRAAMGATGIAVDEGSFQDVELDTIEQGKLDELALLHEGDLDVWRAQVSGTNYLSQAAMHKAAQPSGATVAGTSLMSGAREGLGYYSMFK